MDFSKEASIIWNKRFSPLVNHIHKKHKKLSIEKARIIGFIMGDGSITANDSPSKGSHHDIRFYPDDINVAEMFIKDFEKLYLKKPAIKDGVNHFIIHVSSKPAWDDLVKIGKFNSLNWEFPESLSSKKQKIEWLRAIFDCEAYVDLKKRRIVFQTVSKGGAFSIQNVLKEFDISSKIYTYQRKNPKWNTNYLLFIMGKENVYNFAKEIGFNHALKKNKLDTISRRTRVANGTVSKTVPFGAPRFES